MSHTCINFPPINEPFLFGKITLNLLSFRKTPCGKFSETNYDLVLQLKASFNSRGTPTAPPHSSVEWNY